MNRPEVLDSDDESTPSNFPEIDKYHCNSDDDDNESEDELMNPYEGLPHMELSALTSHDGDSKERKIRDSIEKFDPFSSLHVRERRRPSSDQQQQQWRHDVLLEMEEEIDFLPLSRETKNGQQSNNGSNEIWRTGPSCNSNSELGERSPLSGVGAGRGSSEFFGRSTRANYNENNFRSRLHQIWMTLTSIVNDSSYRSYRGRSPFNSSTFSHTNTKRMRFSQFRMLLISSSILLMMMTLGTIRHVFTSIPSDSASRRNSNLIYEGDTRRPNSLVLKKMETAKRRWWKKNHLNEVEVYGEENKEVDESAIENEVNVGQQTQQSNMQKEQQVNTQQQQQQKQQQTYQTDTAEIIDLAISKISNATHSLLDNSQVPVIVETGEDGSLLIKLSPPRMGTAQPVTNDSPPINTETTIDTSDSQINNGSEDDDTVYIKLPYQQQQPQRRALSTKEEVDPPLRGASIRSHSNLERRPPAPLQFLHKHDKNGHHFHHEHSPGVLDALRSEFGLWMKKHGKRYGSSEEQERRFHTWKKNHFR